MTIRNAEVLDSADIAELMLELGYSADTKTITDRLKRILGARDHLVLVAVIEGKVVGWLQCHGSDVLESGYRAEIVGLVVAKEHRRGGIGRILVNRAEGWANLIGANALVVRSNTKREESHRFYPALGFSTSKTQTVYRKSLRT